MMLIQSIIMFSPRSSDVLGSWIYGLSRDNGFAYCVTARTIVYALILPAIHGQYPVAMGISRQ